VTGVEAEANEGRRLDDRPPDGRRRHVDPSPGRGEPTPLSRVGRRESLRRARARHLPHRRAGRMGPLGLPTSRTGPAAQGRRRGVRPLRGRRRRARRGRRLGLGRRRGFPDGSAACARLRHGLLALRRTARRGLRQKPERVEIAVRVRRDTDAEMEVGAVDLRRPARPDRADSVSLRDRGSLGHRDRAEVRQRHGVAVCRLDRDRLAAVRHRSGEADRPGRRSDHPLARRVRADVDPAMLAGCVRMRLVVGKRLQHRPLHRPCPGVRDGYPDEEEKNGERETPRCCQHEQQKAQRTAGSFCCQI
jgi:hypothetical protein